MIIACWEFKTETYLNISFAWAVGTEYPFICREADITDSNCTRRMAHTGTMLYFVDRDVG